VTLLARLDNKSLALLQIDGEYPEIQATPQTQDERNLK